ncbi:PREDICTED: protein FLX-like 1 [Tarenaya hassleriana]|uniref:protein FLX-like 1 n=1 Tax=Tarenaya hassleriana TaxID=28532 RepID=UPI00053C5F33|nr:PREDICTED: protein FLX-like 1 [Tarenaya hassleriana]XP_010552143.1 PREDICTED: protein FLX-like 1 [Tarenaya hassleriana]
MSGRNRGPPLPAKAGSHIGLQPLIHQPPFVRGMGGQVPPRPPMIDDIRDNQFRVDPRGIPPPPLSIMEEHLAVQNQDVHALLADNQRLAATHVALKQELEVAQHELQRMVHFADSLRADEDIQMREMYDKSLRLEMELREVEAMRAELHKVRADIKELTSARQELTGQVQVMNQDLARLTADLQPIPSMTAEIENTKQELQRARAAIEYEKKGYAENYEHGKIMEQKLVGMARELEKLRAEIANSEKRGHTTGHVGNPGGVGYGAGYGNPEPGYPMNPYQPNYGMNQATTGIEGYPPPYGHPATAAAAASWGGGYDMQRPQGHR